MMHIVVKTVFFHKELGIKAGLPFFSCWCIQKGKMVRSTTAIVKRLIFMGCLILDRLPVITL